MLVLKLMGILFAGKSVGLHLRYVRNPITSRGHGTGQSGMVKLRSTFAGWGRGGPSEMGGCPNFGPRRVAEVGGVTASGKGWEGSPERGDFEKTPARRIQMRILHVLKSTLLGSVSYRGNS
jgi:hypothetical protein